jgi:hypothetical protein
MHHIKLAVGPNKYAKRPAKQNIMIEIKTIGAYIV